MKIGWWRTEYGVIICLYIACVCVCLECLCLIYKLAIAISLRCLLSRVGGFVLPCQRHRYFDILKQFAFTLTVLQFQLQIFPARPPTKLFLRSHSHFSLSLSQYPLSLSPPLPPQTATSPIPRVTHRPSPIISTTSHAAAAPTNSNPDRKRCVSVLFVYVCMFIVGESVCCMRECHNIEPSESRFWDESQYWMGVAFLAAIILIVTLVIAIPCGIAYCVFRWDNRS